MEVLWAERYALFRLGISPLEWGQMAKWQRMDILVRAGLERKAAAEEIRRTPPKQRLGAILRAVAAKVLGF